MDMNNPNGNYLIEARKAMQRFLYLAPEGGIPEWEIKRAKAFLKNTAERFYELVGSSDHYTAEINKDEKELVSEGKILDKLGKPEEALNYYDEALKINPNSKEALYCKGMALFHLKMYEDSIISINKAIEISPQDALAWLNKGVIQFSKGDYSETIKSIDRAVELENNKNSEITRSSCYYKGIALRNLGRFEEAKEMLIIFSADPVKKIAQAQKVKAMIAELDTNIKYKTENERNLRLKAEKQATNAEEWIRKGKALGKLGKNKDALDCFEKALRINPELADAYFLQGVAFYQLKSFKKAKASWQKFLEKAPKDSSNIQLAKKWMEDIIWFEAKETP
jgi:tetratricopeptide (TPR) repeat protein